MMNKVHWIRDDQPTWNPRKVITHCGREGWACEGFDTEFDTAVGDRFEAERTMRGVNCKVCLRSAERISNRPRRRQTRA